MRAYLPLWWQKRDRSRTRSPDRRERMSTPEKEPPNERDIDLRNRWTRDRDHKLNTQISAELIGQREPKEEADNTKFSFR